jgi:hypothetical protein
MLSITHQHDELNQPLAAHEAADGNALPPQQLARLGRQRGANHLAEKGGHDNGNDIAPGDAVVEHAEVGVEARQRKVQRQEDDRDKVLNLLGQLDGEAALVRADEADEKGAKDGVDADDGGEPRREQRQ